VGVDINLLLRLIVLDLDTGSLRSFVVDALGVGAAEGVDFCHDFSVQHDFTLGLGLRERLFDCLGQSAGIGVEERHEIVD